MSLSMLWFKFKLLHWSHPTGDRALYRAVTGRKIDTILEVNIGDATRSERLVTWLRHQGNQAPIRYAAIDQFEMNGQGGIGLKTFHQQMRHLGVKPLPIPGTLAQGIGRAANSLGPVQLAIFDVPESEMQHPIVAAQIDRIVGPETLVLARSGDSQRLQVLPTSHLSKPAPKTHAA